MWIIEIILLARFFVNQQDVHRLEDTPFQLPLSKLLAVGNYSALCSLSTTTIQTTVKDQTNIVHPFMIRNPIDYFIQLGIHLVELMQNPLLLGEDVFQAIEWLDNAAQVCVCIVYF